ncbi:LRR domain containing protein [Parasponia andersonii]|uniref:LRR domain containing protein n=1 Tax=Parasponia andersonii TaxID=3476 RepID=A0A2P5ACT5_PARAD|nr:LRR domain containing protein [Parasponia andersonii]
MLIICISLMLHLWQLGPDFKFQTIAQNLPPEEVSALKDMSNKLGRKQPFEFNASVCIDDQRFAIFVAGISCDCTYDNNRTCHVTKLFWNDDGLTGNVPEEVANLTHLEELNLSGNELYGAIPDFLGNMTSLYQVDLSNNQLSGPIPDSVGNLKAQAQNL